jgi:hypothetical protein
LPFVLSGARALRACSVKNLIESPDMKSFAAVVAALLVTAGAANAGEIVINPKASDRAVVLTLRGGKVVKASVIAKPESMAKLEHLKDTAASP